MLPSGRGRWNCTECTPEGNARLKKPPIEFFVARLFADIATVHVVSDSTRAAAVPPSLDDPPAKPVVGRDPLDVDISAYPAIDIRTMSTDDLEALRTILGKYRPDVDELLRAA
jgi:hypothetical protein